MSDREPDIAPKVAQLLRETWQEKLKGEGWLSSAEAADLQARLRECEEALSWALDVLEITLKRLDTVDPPDCSAESIEHLKIRAAGIRKARAALPGEGEKRDEQPSGSYRCGNEDCGEWLHAWEAECGNCGWVLE